jgi:ABC-2 type transport system ATP-binding protein
MSKPIVEIKNVSKKIGKKLIIDNLSLEIFPGEVFGFLGPNGAGKTTTIRMLLGLASMTSGEITINNHSIKNEFRSAISCVGGIVENPEMYKYMSGYDNLLHFSRMHQGISKERIDEIVDFIGLQNRIYDKVKKYSLGMRQRLGVAQALLHKPKLLVLDEPTNGLDPAGIKELRDKLRELAQKENIAVMVSSHLLSEMELMCDRVGIIQNGKLIKVKKLNEFTVETGSIDVLIDAKPLDKAMQIIKNTIPNTEMIMEEQIIKINIVPQSIPSIVEALVEGKVLVYEISKIKKSLEDKFLEVTGGNIIE